MNDRIKLAEAMGWEQYEDSSVPMWRTPPILIQRFEDKVGQQSLYSEFVNEDELPDPFTDANDDYAVLEWMRGDKRPDRKYHSEWNSFCYAIDADNSDEVKASTLVTDYQIGDYARAALKVIE